MPDVPINIFFEREPVAIRYAGPDEADNYYDKSFNLDLIIDKFLNPIYRDKSLSLKLKTLDLQTDDYTNERTYNIKPETIVIFEGVFLFRRDLAPYIDLKVFLNILFVESKKRAVVRDPQAYVEKYDVKYLPAQQKYLTLYPPDQIADIFIDNSNWEYPRLKNL